MTNQFTAISLISITFFISTEVFCQVDINTPKDPASEVFITNIIYVTPTFLTWLITHEFGHYSTAFVFGAKNARMGLYRQVNGNTSIGWAQWDKNSMNNFGTACAHLGGVLFSRGLAESSDLLLKNTSLPGWGQRYFSMLFIFSRFDMPRYILQDALLSFIGKKGSDIDDFVSVTANNNKLRTLTYAGLLIITTVDLIIDWKRITLHWNILKGGRYHSTKPSKMTALKISPYFESDAVGINLQTIF